jgi:hypothetical protein
VTDGKVTEDNSVFKDFADDLGEDEAAVDGIYIKVLMRNRF